MTLTLEQRNSMALTLEQRIERLEAALQVQNLMGRYSFWHSANMHKECVELFSRKNPNTRVEMMWGVYEGPEGVVRCYPGFHVWADGDPTGKMHMHTLTTPVIEVAEDGQTAKGVWVSPGHETGPTFTSPEIKAHWAWCKYACDFIKEDGEWKIWHLHVYGLFMTPYERSWVEGGDEMGDPPPMPKEYAPDRPPTTHWQWRADRVYANEPAPPAPYKTFDEKTAY